jgi:galactonate dehydratase
MTLTLARISPKTLWCFLEISFADGACGIGEATLPGRETTLLEVADACLPVWLRDQALLQPVTAATPIATSALITALDVAVADARGRRANHSIAAMLGGDPARHVPVYANINRRTLDRSPAGFAASAAHATAQGFTAVKIAPFDEVDVAACRAGNGTEAMRNGLERIAAVRATLGPRCRLMVDCHWRFDAATAASLIAALRPFELYWLECPLPETPETMDDLVSLRRAVNAQGTRLAGLEEFVGRDSFAAYAHKGCYDVMMPDMKYVGGFGEMLATADQLAGLGVEVSPHNPTGPICHAASLQVSAALPALTMLEMQLDETPLFWDLASPPLTRPAEGSHPLPHGPGLGIALDPALLGTLAVTTRRYEA